MKMKKRFFHIAQEFDITTIFPLVLFIYKKITNEDERLRILKILESYITRRTICKLTTKNYNNLFLSLLAEAKRMPEVSAENIRKKLLSFTESSNKFPTDEELKVAFETSHLINKYSREVLYCIALYELKSNFTDNPKLNFGGFSVEHIMPKKWKNNWIWSDETLEEIRNHKLLTIGNLTLVKGKLNSSMRDSNWSKKKENLRKYSTLRQTTDYLHLDDWNEKEIGNRADSLYKTALKMWER